MDRKLIKSDFVFTNQVCSLRSDVPHSIYKVYISNISLIVKFTQSSIVLVPLTKGENCHLRYYIIHEHRLTSERINLDNVIEHVIELEDPCLRIHLFISLEQELLVVDRLYVDGLFMTNKYMGIYDTTLVVNGRRLYASREELYKNKFFSLMMDVIQKDEYDLGDLDLMAFNIFIRFIHGKPIKLTKCNVNRVLALADFLLDDRLIDRCILFFLKTGMDAPEKYDMELLKHIFSQSNMISHKHACRSLRRFLNRCYDGVYGINELYE